MMIDASALVAILTNEPEGSSLAAEIENAKAPFTSPIAIFETTLALMRIYGCSAEQASAFVRRLLDASAIKVTQITDAMANGAVIAFDKYGKGRSPAQLNMGDCFAYAAAKYFRSPLLFKGDDFTKTDVNDRVRH